MQRDKYINQIKEKCINCRKCVDECFFLQEFGSPIEILKSEKKYDITFNCTLCGLCTEVCPLDLDPCSMFHGLREIKNQSGHDFKKTHSPFLNFEKMGHSKYLTFYKIPENCESVFFPGCNFSGTRSDLVLKIYQELKVFDKNTGIILDCCGTPSKSLGITDEHEKRFNEIKRVLNEKKIKKVFLSCPNCFSVFKASAEEFEIEMVPGFFLRKNYSLVENFTGEKLYLHDPCVFRKHESVMNDTREILKSSGVDFFESEHSHKKTLCCGGGGGLFCYNPEISKKWKDLIIEESQKKKIITYCAGCQDSLGENTFHIMDLFFKTKDEIKPVKSPLTYLKRFFLKKKLKKNLEKTDYIGFRRKGKIIEK